MLSCTPGLARLELAVGWRGRRASRWCRCRRASGRRRRRGRARSCGCARRAAAGGPNSSMWSISRAVRAGDALPPRAPAGRAAAMRVSPPTFASVRCCPCVLRRRKNQLPPHATSPVTRAEVRARRRSPPRGSGSSRRSRSSPCCGPRRSTLHHADGRLDAVRRPGRCARGARASPRRPIVPWPHMPR